MTWSPAQVVARIEAGRAAISFDRALIVGISGIDGSGKGFVTAQIADRLRKHSLTVTVVGADAWLNVPSVRFNDTNPGLHFYENALRLDQMFSQVISPLRRGRNLKCEVDHLAETASSFRKHGYEFDQVDVVLVEGIFLFKLDCRHYFDLRIWIDCSFETALQRAIHRGQEGLSPEQTIVAYEKIYFPAQRIHLERDSPIKAADITLPNDTRT
jgi:uridine kinase